MFERPLVSDEAKEVWKHLTPEEKERINKCFPFRQERNEMIRSLWCRGVKQITLAEITGLSTVTICRVCHEEWIREKRAER